MDEGLSNWPRTRILPDPKISVIARSSNLEALIPLSQGESYFFVGPFRLVLVCGCKWWT